MHKQDPSYIEGFFDEKIKLKKFDGNMIAMNPFVGTIYNRIAKVLNGEKVCIFGLTTAKTKDISCSGKDVDFTEQAFEKKGSNTNQVSMRTGLVIKTPSSN